MPVDIMGSATTSTFQLQAGDYYELTASGYFDLGGPDSSYTADAEYAWYFSSCAPNDSRPIPNGVDYGISVWRVSGQTAPLESSYKATYWGLVSIMADHSYTIGFLATQTGPISFRYFDDYYPDNEPLTYPMQVEIYQALPSSPAELTATADRPSLEINLAWTNIATDATGIVLQRAPSNGVYQTIATLPPDSTTYSDTSAAVNTEYRYRLYATNAFGQSEPSNTAFAFMLNSPPQIAAIPSQVAYAGQEFNFSIDATDPQDGKAGLTYAFVEPPTIQDDFGDEATPLVTISSDGEISWSTPSSDAGYSGVWEIQVTDAEGSSATAFMNIAVAPPSASIPHTTPGGTPAYVVSQTTSTVTLAVAGVDSTSTNGADISYTWETISQPPDVGSPTFSSANGTNGASQIVVTVYGAGAYQFEVRWTTARAGQASVRFLGPSGKRSEVSLSRRH